MPAFAAAGEPVVESMEAAMNVPVGLTDELFDWAGKRMDEGAADAFWTRLQKAGGAGAQARTARAFAALLSMNANGSQAPCSPAALASAGKIGCAPTCRNHAELPASGSCRGAIACQ